MQAWKARQIVELEDRRETIIRMYRLLLNNDKLAVSSPPDGGHHHQPSVTVPTEAFAPDLIRHALIEVRAIEDQMRNLGCTDFDSRDTIEQNFVDTPYANLENDIREELGLQAPSDCRDLQ